MDSGRIEFLCSRGTSATPSSSGSASLHGGLPAQGRPETAAGLSVPGPLRKSQRSPKPSRSICEGSSAFESLAVKTQLSRESLMPSGIGHTSWDLAQRPSLGVMLNP